MAKRKRGGRKGFNLSAVKDYRSERFIPYIMRAEIGILQAGTIDPDLTDGQVSSALDDLVQLLHDPESLQRWLNKPVGTEAEPLTVGEETKPHFIHSLIFMNLRDAFATQGPIPAEDVIGILKVIKTSVKRWGHGAHRRGYLTYIEGFLGQMGAHTRRLSKDEAEALGLPNLIQGDDDE